MFNILRRTPALMLALALWWLTTVPAAAQSAPRVLLDGRTVGFDVPPVVEGGRTLVPVRAIFEALGAKVSWDGKTKTVAASRGGTEVRLVVGGKAYKNGTPVALDVPARIVSDRVMVPVRFVSESMGCQVAWNSATRTISITSAPGRADGAVVGKVNFTSPVLGNSRLPILMFHTVNSVKPQGGLDPHWEWSFRQLMGRMHKEGYRTITAKEACDFNLRGVRLPEKSVWLTFDDGWEDNLTVAAPIMAEYGYVATIFVETSKIGEYLRLNGDQIAALRNKYNWDIQLHGHVGHRSIPTDGKGGQGSFYNDLMWLKESSRLETMEERHARVKADLESSIGIIRRYNPAYCFAYPSDEHGATPGIKADNDRVMDELGIMGVNVGRAAGEQIVPLSTTSRHNLCRIGIDGDTSYDQIFTMDNFGILVLPDKSPIYTKYPVFDRANNRFVVGTHNGMIMTVGNDWKVAIKPAPVQGPPASSRPRPASGIVPAILSNGDIWVGSVNGSVLYKLDLKDLTKPASREIGLDFSPRNVVNDGDNLYAFDAGGAVKKVDLATGKVSDYCALPNGGEALYSGSVLAGGQLYAYDAKRNHIVKYDFINKKPVKIIKWDPSGYQLQPWHIIDENSILTFCNKHWRQVVLEH